MSKPKVNPILTTSVLTLFLLSILTPLAIAQIENDEGDILIYGLELDKLLAMVNAWLALFLFIILLTAYKRDGRKRLLYVSVAFLLFSIKSFLIASELILPEVEFLDPLAIILEFAAILTFFFGVLKK
jgi:hypothetical protein